MRAVNLLPRREDEANQSDSPRVVALVAAVGSAVVLVALIAGFIASGRSVETQQSALAQAKAELAALQPKQPAGSSKRAALLSERERRAVALASALSKRVSWDRVLRRLSIVLPSDIWLTSLTGSTPLVPTAGTTSTPGATPTTSSLPAKPTGLTIEGFAYSQDAVARLMTRLQVVPDLSNVQLQTSRVTQVAGRDVVQFTILSDVERGGDTS